MRDDYLFSSTTDNFSLRGEISFLCTRINLQRISMILAAMWLSSGQGTWRSMTIATSEVVKELFKVFCHFLEDKMITAPVDRERELSVGEKKRQRHWRAKMRFFFFFFPSILLLDILLRDNKISVRNSVISNN